MSDADQITVLRNLVQQIGQLNKSLSTVLPLIQSTASTATAGAATLPANPLGFINTTLPNGTAVKLPYYSP